MISFRNFLEIAVNTDMNPPKSTIGSFRGPSMTHLPDDSSHKIIPFVIHSNLAQLFTASRRIDKFRNNAKFAPAMSVFDRLEDQIGGGGPVASAGDMLVTYISNSEAQSIMDLGSDMVEEANSELARSFSTQEGKRAVEEWERYGNLLKKSVQNGIDFLKLNLKKGN